MKYVRDRPIELLIWFNTKRNGSHIWKKTWVGRLLVQSHCFWEIGNGDDANFWDESWNQFPKFGMDLRWKTIWEVGIADGRVKVSDYLEEASMEGFRRWTDYKWMNGMIRLEGLQAFTATIKERLSQAT